MFVIVLFIVLGIIFILSLTNKNTFGFEQDNFKQIIYSNYPYDPKIPTPQTNYDDMEIKINSQQKYKSKLSTSLSPIPIINCSSPSLTNKLDCNNYGCNWYDTYCSSIYPTQL